MAAYGVSTAAACENLAANLSSALPSLDDYRLSTR